jgi:hypothetical protein
VHRCDAAALVAVVEAAAKAVAGAVVGPRKMKAKVETELEFAVAAVLLLSPVVQAVWEAVRAAAH